MPDVIYDIPDVDRVRQMMFNWSAIQMHKYISELYLAVTVRDNEIVVLERKLKEATE